MISVLFLPYSIIGFAQEPEPPTKPPNATPWPQEIWDRIGSKFTKSEFEKLGIKIENAIFDEIENIKFKTRVLPVVTIDGRLGRNIYNNWDPRSPPKDGFSWSVVDKLGLTVNFTALNFPIAVPGTPLVFSFNVGSGFGLDFFHIRQVFDWSLKTQNELKEDTEAIKNESTLNLQVDQAFYPQERAKLQRKARRKKFLNMITHPFRFPLGMNRFTKMKVGDIYAYSANGVLSIGVNAGIVPVDYKLLQLNANAFLNTYLTGNFRISLYKFTENSIRMKITPGTEEGINYGIGSNNRATYLNGFFVLQTEKFKGIKVPKQTVEIIPFTLNRSRVHKDMTEFVYNFQLDSPEAEMALEHALKGDLSDAQFLALQNKVVQSVYEKSEEQNIQKNNQRMKFAWFIETKNDETTTFTKYKITYPDGKESEIFETERKSEMEHKNDIGFREVQTYSAVASLDQECLEQSKTNCFQLQTNFYLLDSNTKYKEMMEIVDMAEKVLDADIFPDFQEEFEEVHGEKKIRKKFFWGKSEMQLGQILGQSQIEEFLSLNEDFMWNLIGHIFHPKGQTTSWDTAQERFWYQVAQTPEMAWDFILTPFAPWKNEGKELTYAQRFNRLWKRLKKRYLTNSVGFFHDKNNVNDLSELLNAPKFSKEIMTLLRACLKQNIPYTFIDLTSTSLGTARILQKNPSVLNEDIIKNQEVTNYDIFPKTLFFRPTINFRRFAFQEFGKYLEIDFGLDVGVVPKYLQFELHKQVGRTIPGNPPRTKQVGESIFYENSQLKFLNQTKMTLVELRTLPGMEELLAKINDENDFYLAMSYSLNKSEWSSKERVLIHRKP